MVGTIFIILVFSTFFFYLIINWVFSPVRGSGTLSVFVSPLNFILTNSDLTVVRLGFPCVCTYIQNPRLLNPKSYKLIQGTGISRLIFFEVNGHDLFSFFSNGRRTTSHLFLDSRYYLVLEFRSIMSRHPKFKFDKVIPLLNFCSLIVFFITSYYFEGVSSFTYSK